MSERPEDREVVQEVKLKEAFDLLVVDDIDKLLTVVDETATAKLDKQNFAGIHFVL